MQLILVCGTDTDVGKTQVSGSILANLAKAKRYFASYKPVQTGGEGFSQDLLKQEDLMEAELATSFHEQDAQYYLGDQFLSSYIFSEEVSPHLASRLAHTQVSITQILDDLQTIANKRYEFAPYPEQDHNLKYVKLDALVVELAGGLMSPLSDFTTNLDLIKEIHSLAQTQGWELKVLLVTNNKLGTISATLTASQLLPQLDLLVYNTFSNRQPPELDYDLLKKHKAGLTKGREEEAYEHMLEAVESYRLHTEVSFDNYSYYGNLQQSYQAIQQGILEQGVVVPKRDSLAGLYVPGSLMDTLENLLPYLQAEDKAKLQQTLSIASDEQALSLLPTLLLQTVPDLTAIEADKGQASLSVTEIASDDSPYKALLGALVLKEVVAEANHLALPESSPLLGKEIFPSFHHAYDLHLLSYFSPANQNFILRKYLSTDSKAFESTLRSNPLVTADLVLFNDNLAGYDFITGKVDPQWLRSQELAYINKMQGELLSLYQALLLK